MTYHKNIQQQYKAQSIGTMTQGELLLLVYDELIKRLTQGELALNQQNFTLFEESVQRGMDIITYLDDTLDKQYEISKDLARLYEYFLYDLGRAKIGRNLEVLRHVRCRANDLREAFRTAQKTAGTEKQGV